jgi:hypothetical protein
MILILIVKVMRNMIIVLHYYNYNNKYRRNMGIWVFYSIYHRIYKK